MLLRVIGAFLLAWPLSASAAPLDDLLSGFGSGWIEAPDTRLVDVFTQQGEFNPLWCQGAKAGAPPAVVAVGDWTGMAINGQSIWFTGGGHRGWCGNGMYHFDIPNLVWSRARTDSVQPTGVDDNTNTWSECPYPEPNDPNTTPPGGPLDVPKAKHTTDGILWHPERQTIFLVGGTDYCRYGGKREKDLWEFDPVNATYQYHGIIPSGNDGVAGVAIHPLTGNIMAVLTNGLKQYDPDTATWTVYNTGISSGWGTGTLAVDPDRQEFICFRRL